MTFCWLPPERDDTFASSDAAFTDSEPSVSPTMPSSRLRFMSRPVRNLLSADTAAFSRTDRRIMRPSLSRSAGR